MDYAAGNGSGKEWAATLDKVLALDIRCASFATRCIWPFPPEGLNGLYDELSKF